MKTEHTTPGKS